MIFSNFWLNVLVYLLSIMLSLFSFDCASQEPSNKVLANSLGVKSNSFPSLGMKVLSIDGDKHVLMSNNGRYIIKGSLQDLWEGVERTFVDINPVNTVAAEQVFKFINKEELAVVLGSESGTPIDIFMSYSCKQCKLLTQQIMSKRFLSRFHVNVFVVYANEFDERIAKDIFCGLDKKQRFIQRFVNRDISNLETSCAPNEPRLSISYANVLPVRSLPATLSFNKKLYYGALPENF